MSTSSPSPPTLGSFNKPGPHDWGRDALLVCHPFRDTPFLVIPIRVCPLADGTQSDWPCIPLTAVLDACLVVTGQDGQLVLDKAGQQVVHTNLVTVRATTTSLVVTQCSIIRSSIPSTSGSLQGVKRSQIAGLLQSILGSE